MWIGCDRQRCWQATIQHCFKVKNSDKEPPGDDCGICSTEENNFRNPAEW